MTFTFGGLQNWSTLPSTSQDPDQSGTGCTLSHPDSHLPHESLTQGLVVAGHRTERNRAGWGWIQVLFLSEQEGILGGCWIITEALEKIKMHCQPSQTESALLGERPPSMLKALASGLERWLSG